MTVFKLAVFLLPIMILPLPLSVYWINMSEMTTTGTVIAVKHANWPWNFTVVTFAIGNIMTDDMILFEMGKRIVKVYEDNLNLELGKVYKITSKGFFLRQVFPTVIEVVEEIREGTSR